MPLVAHATPVGATSPTSRTCKFDFQTHFWQPGVVITAPLATLPGRPCPIAAALDVVGERWALLVVREIALGANRFSAIVRGTGAPRDRIAARLRTLEDAGVVVRVPYQSAPPRDEYRLTASGYALVPVLDALLTWGEEFAVAPDDPDRQRSYPTFTARTDHEETT